MAYILVALASLVVSALTLFSGFGLGTLLMPVFALFFPVELAIAATAIVHLANNIFKVFLVGRKARLKVVAAFAIPATIAAVIGALCLGYFVDIAPIYSYELFGRSLDLTAVKLTIGILIVIFGLLEIIPFFETIALDSKYIPLGGFLSGFFGGLSGHQGALRTTFLMRLGMPKEEFVGTVVLSAVIVDVFRIAVYGFTFMRLELFSSGDSAIRGLVAAGIIFAFIGSFTGARILKKVTMKFINRLVGAMLIALGFGIAAGVL
ncbi:MAG: TSUP family transporter [Myxococcales bacterium]|nr:TSUP family transporter [Myxococcales bacterium]